MNARLLLSLALVAATNLQAQQKVALVGGTLIDGTGGRPVRNSVILIDGERITAIGTVDSKPVPTGYRVISTEGMSVLPGLWDMHVHTMINGHGTRHWTAVHELTTESGNVSCRPRRSSC